MKRLKNKFVAAAVLACAILLLVVGACLSNEKYKREDTGSELHRYHRNLRFSFFAFADPKSVALKPPIDEGAVDDDVDKSEHLLFHVLQHPKNLQADVPPLPFHLDPNPPEEACDGIVLFLPDSRGGYGVGSQLNGYLIAVFAATYLDMALVLDGKADHIGCPNEMLDQDALAGGDVVINTEAAASFPKSLSRLIDHPDWLSRRCPVPCQKSHSLADWEKLAKDYQHDTKAAPAELTCENDNGRQTKVIFMNGMNVHYYFAGHLHQKMIDRSSKESLAIAYNWALRLGADVDEASIFATLRAEDDIWDYVSALASRSGAIQFQPWVSRDVEQYVREIDSLPFEGGDYDAVHVRRGDKVFREAKMFVNDYWKDHTDEERKIYIPFKHYLSQFFEKKDHTDEERKIYIPFKHYLSQIFEKDMGVAQCGTRHVYIATDDPTEVHKEIAELPNDMRGFSYLSQGNDCLKFKFLFGPQWGGMGSYHNLAYKRRKCTDLYHCFVASIGDLTVLSRSRTFVGEYNSNWGRFVRFFRLLVNDVSNVREGGPPVIENDVRIAWGNTDAKHIISENWKKIEVP